MRTKEFSSVFTCLVFLDSTEAFGRNGFRKSQAFDERIEYFTEHTKIKLEQLLLVDISGTLSKLKFHTRTSLLLGEMEHSRALAEKSRKKRRASDILGVSVGPWYLNALTAPQFIAVVSDALTYKERDKYDFYQNIRHKCVILLFCEKIRYLVQFSSMYGIPYFIMWNSTSFFECNRGNNIVSWRDTRFKDKPRECTEAKALQARIADISVLPSNYIGVSLDLSSGRNTTRVQLNIMFRAVSIQARDAEDLQFHHTAKNNIIDMNHFDECYMAQRRLPTDVLTLLEPFPLSVWLLFSLSIILLSLAHKFLERTSFTETLCGTVFNFIYATPIVFENRRSSALLICVVTVAMNFYMGNLYGNDVITRFVDSSELCEYKGFFQFRLNYACDSRATLVQHFL